MNETFLLSPHAMQNLINRWYHAEKNNIDTTNRVELYADTERVITFLKKEKGDVSKIKGLCTTFIESFNSYSQREQLTEWVARHTLYTGSSTKFQGAYPPLHSLLQEVLENSLKLFFPLKSLEILSYIDSGSLYFIERERKGITNIENILYSKLDIKELHIMSKVSVESRKVARSVLADRFNSNEVTLEKLKIKTVTDLIAIFGESCSKITTLNLQNYPLQNRDIEMISTSFINLSHLYLKDANITDDSVIFFKKLSFLTHLKLSTCDQIHDLSSLKECPLLTHLNLSWCDKITDFSFLNLCPQLTDLNLAWCDQIKDLKFLEGCLKLKNLTLLECSGIKDFSSLRHCTMLEQLILCGCSQVLDLSFLRGNTLLIELDLSSCNQIRNFEYLKCCPLLKTLDLSECYTIKDLNFLEYYNTLTLLKISRCDQIKDFSFLKHCFWLTSLDLSLWKQIPFIDFRLYCPLLKTLDITECDEVDKDLLELLSEKKIEVIKKNQKTKLSQSTDSV